MQKQFSRKVRFAKTQILDHNDSEVLFFQTVNLVKVIVKKQMSRKAAKSQSLDYSGCLALSYRLANEHNNGKIESL